MTSQVMSFNSKQVTNLAYAKKFVSLTILSRSYEETTLTLQLVATGDVLPDILWTC